MIEGTLVPIFYGQRFNEVVITDRVRAIVEDIIKDQADLFIIDVIIKGQGPKQKVLVILDGDDGVTIDRCAQISRTLGHTIEEEALFSEPYQLEVSSAGLDMPLANHRQYLKNTGRNVKVYLEEGDIVEGKLEKVNENAISLVIKGTKKSPDKEMEIALKDIKKTLVTVSFK